MRSKKDIIKEIDELYAELGRLKALDVYSLTDCEIEQASFKVQSIIARSIELRQESEMVRRKTLKDFITEAMQRS